MQFSSLVTSLLCIAVAQVAAAEDVTSQSTTTITKTLIRVNSVTATPSSSMTIFPATSTPLVTPTSATPSAASATKTGAAAYVGAGMPAVLGAGSFALIMGLAV